MASKFKNIYYGFLMGIFALGIFTIFTLKQGRLLMNIELVQDYNSVQTHDKYDDNEKLKTLVPNEILTNDTNFIIDVNKTLNYVATVVDGKYFSNTNLTAYQKLQNILSQNGGGICGDLAMILKEVLEAKGYKARTIQLLRQVGSSFDSHMVTEVWDEKQNKFILLDPTFNFMMAINNKYINAYELKKALLYNKKQVRILENKQEKASNYQKYYVNYFSLYNNVLIVRANHFTGYKRIFTRFPILHNYWGGKYFICNTSLGGISKLYKVFYFYIPLFFIMNLFVIIFVKFRYRRK